MLLQGYFLAAFLFLGIVFSLPVCMGMASLALDLPVNVNEALAGLVFPATAYVILGKAGEALLPGHPVNRALIRREGHPIGVALCSCCNPCKAYSSCLMS